MSTDWPAVLDRIRRDTFVADVEWHATIGSTNTRALQLAAGGDAACPYLILAAEQTAGRGRGNHQWVSSEGSLTFSLLVQPAVTFERRHWSLLALYSGLALSETLREFGARNVGLKWPNDAYLDGRKVAGILIEAAPRQIVIGMGVNLNNSLAQAPPEVQARSISVCQALGGRVELEDFLVRLLRHLEREIDFCTRQQRLDVMRWSRVCVLSHKVVRLRAAGQETVGRCAGVAEDGGLLLANERGVQSYHAGEILSFE